MRPCPPSRPHLLPLLRPCPASPNQPALLLPLSRSQDSAAPYLCLLWARSWNGQLPFLLSLCLAKSHDPCRASPVVLTGKPFRTTLGQVCWPSAPLPPPQCPARPSTKQVLRNTFVRVFISALVIPPEHLLSPCSVRHGRAQQQRSCLCGAQCPGG